MSKFDNFAVVFSNYVLRHRFITLLTVIAIVFSSAYGAQFLGFNTNYRAFFSADNPQLKDFEELQSVYTKTDNVMFVLKPKNLKEGETAFNAETLSAIKEFTKAGWELPFATRVDSVTNYQYSYAEEDDLIVADLVEKDPNKLSNTELNNIKDIALAEELLIDRIVAKDAQTLGVNVTFSFPGKSIMEVPTTAGKSRELLSSIQEKYPNIEMVASGLVFMNNAFSESSQNDMTTLIPIMYGILLVAMIFFLRSFWSTIATLLVIAFSALSAMGIAGWLGVKLTPPSATAPTIILTLAIADSIHIIITMLKNMQSGMSKNDAIVDSLRINFQPVFLTSFSTIIGFLCLNFSDVPPFHDLGNITAIGVAFAFLFSIMFLPVILSILPIKVKKIESTDKKAKYKFAETLGEFVIARRNPILIVSIIIAAILVAQISRIELNDKFVQYFDHSISFRGDSEFMMDNLTGIYTFEFSFPSQGEQGITQPEYLHGLDKFSSWLRKQEEVRNVYSITDIMKRINKNLNYDKPEEYKLPDNKKLGSQYLLLYEMSLPYGLDLNDRINIDKSSSRLTVTLRDMSTVEIRTLKTKYEAWIKANLPDYMYTEATSPIVMFAFISQRNIDSMISGNMLAFVLITISIIIALRSFRIGMYSMIPNLLPALMGFGVWGILISEINMAVAIVASVSLGIIVDDSVHFLSKYYRARKEKNLNAEDSVRYAFATVGPAIIATTAILTFGFSILLFSGFQMNSTLGLLTSIIIILALVADLFLLPPMLMLLDRKKKTKDSAYTAETTEGGSNA